MLASSCVNEADVRAQILAASRASAISPGSERGAHSQPLDDLCGAALPRAIGNCLLIERGGPSLIDAAARVRGQGEMVVDRLLVCSFVWLLRFCGASSAQSDALADALMAPTRSAHAFLVLLTRTGHVDRAIGGAPGCLLCDDFAPSWREATGGLKRLRTLTVDFGATDQEAGRASRRAAATWLGGGGALRRAERAGALPIVLLFRSPEPTVLMTGANVRHGKLFSPKRLRWAVKLHAGQLPRGASDGLFCKAWRAGPAAAAATLQQPRAASGGCDDTPPVPLPIFPAWHVAGAGELDVPAAAPSGAKAKAPPTPAVPTRSPGGGVSVLDVLNRTERSSAAALNHALLAATPGGAGRGSAGLCLVYCLHRGAAQDAGFLSACEQAAAAAQGSEAGAVPGHTPASLVQFVHAGADTDAGAAFVNAAFGFDPGKPPTDNHRLPLVAAICPTRQAFPRYFMIAPSRLYPAPGETDRFVHGIVAFARRVADEALPKLEHVVVAKLSAPADDNRPVAFPESVGLDEHITVSESIAGQGESCPIDPTFETVSWAAPAFHKKKQALANHKATPQVQQGQQQGRQHAAVGDNYDDNDLLDPSSVPGPDLNPFLSALIDDIKTYVSEDDDEGIGADEL